MLPSVAMDPTVSVLTAHVARTHALAQVTTTALLLNIVIIVESWAVDLIKLIVLTIVFS